MEPETSERWASDREMESIFRLLIPESGISAREFQQGFRQVGLLPFDFSAKPMKTISATFGPGNFPTENLMQQEQQKVIERARPKERKQTPEEIEEERTQAQEVRTVGEKSKVIDRRRFK